MPQTKLDQQTFRLRMVACLTKSLQTPQATKLGKEVVMPVSMPLFTIDIAIPVLNEERNLEMKVRTVCGFLDGSREPLQSAGLIIADNGSVDQTAYLAKLLEVEIDRVQFATVPERGVGGALQAAWAQSTADVVGYMDLDLATDLRHLLQVVELFEEGADVVSGSRLMPGSKVIGRRMIRTVTSVIFNGLIRMVFSSKISDGMSGFKFLRRSLLPYIHAGGATNSGWFYATELLLVSEVQELDLREIPIQWLDDPVSRVRILSLAAEYICDMRDLKKRLG